MISKTVAAGALVLACAATGEAYVASPMITRSGRAVITSQNTACAAPRAICPASNPLPPDWPRQLHLFVHRPGVTPRICSYLRP